MAGTNRFVIQTGNCHAERPALLNRGFEGEILDDDNRDATVSVQFRKLVDSNWSQALPLLGVGDENIYRRKEELAYIVPTHWLAQCSMFRLVPSTSVNLK